MQKMINAVQNYAWGSHDALSKLYGFSNPDNKPMAELWMGAHPLSSSKVLDKNGNKVSLRDEIAKDVTGNLGSAAASLINSSLLMPMLLPPCMALRARRRRLG